MKIVADGELISREEIVIAGMNFGQLLNGVEGAPFEIEVALEELKDLFESRFNEIIEENKEDDLRTESSAAYIEMVETNYAHMSNSLANFPMQFCLIIRDYLYFEFLTSLLGTFDLTRCRYVINNLESVEIVGNALYVSGIAFRPPVPSAVSTDESEPE